jgi:hypothetical protein
VPVQQIHHPPIALKLLACKNPRFFVCDVERGAAVEGEKEGDGAEAKAMMKS